MRRPLRLLHIEDSEDDAALIARKLEQGGYALSVARVATPGAMHAALRDHKWDLVIADWNLPQFSALFALEQLKCTEVDLPFIIVSGAVGEEAAVKAMKAGAHDYVMKDNLNRLVPVIEREVREADARRKRRKTEVALHEIEQRLELAIEGASRMQHLIEDLLAYSHIGSKARPLEPVDCSSVLKDALANLKVALEQSNAVITHDPLPAVLADGKQLTQLFQNLIGNAIKYCGTTRPEIHISVEPQEEAWWFSVRDNGIGLDPQFYERIFVIFQRLHTKTEYPGTGIGLAICKKIVERHGGRIWVESQPSLGNVFYFSIPRTVNVNGTTGPEPGHNVIVNGGEIAVLDPCPDRGT